MDEIAKSDSPQLSVLRKHGGEDLVIQNIYLIVDEVVNFFNVGKTMTTNQIKQTAELILSEFWMLKPEDFKLCFANAKKGVYGKVYDRIDGQVICEWLFSYTNERANYFESRQVNKIEVNPELAKQNLEQFKKLREEIAPGYDAEKEKQYQDYRRARILDEFKNSQCEGRGEPE